MGSFILCHPKKANQPYYLEDVRLNIYTIEELCFYLCNNLYLLSHNVMSKELCSWIDAELGMNTLADDLRSTIPSMSLSRFVLAILQYVGFCDDEELDEIQHTLMSLREQTEEEQRKRKADNLLKNGKYEHAIQEYRQILRTTVNEKLGKEFYGKVHHNMGTALAKQFLFKEAAEEFLTAYQMANKKEMLKEYLCACYMDMNEESFRELIDENRQFAMAAEQMLEEYSDQERQYHFYQEQRSHTYGNTRKRIEEMKEEYRKSLV